MNCFRLLSDRLRSVLTIEVSENSWSLIITECIHKNISIVLNKEVHLLILSLSMRPQVRISDNLFAYFEMVRYLCEFYPSSSERL